ncbi:MAG: D-glycero-beta-D-manno-heptose 1-phosphate adenylyltransferase [Verrucomicrobiota bacterium]
MKIAASKKRISPSITGIIHKRMAKSKPDVFSFGEAASHRQTDAMNFRSKIIAWDKLPEWRKDFRSSGKKLVVTNGCFDILHLGHVTYLENARNFGDALLVGINSDAATQQLKGAGRPVNSENDRATVLAALESVDGVCIFTDKTATKFLVAAQPDIYVKGGDYTLDTLNQDERRAVESAGGKIVIVPFLPGKSTTALLEKISRL